MPSCAFKSISWPEQPGLNLKNIVAYNEYCHRNATKSSREPSPGIWRVRPKLFSFDINSIQKLRQREIASWEVWDTGVWGKSAIRHTTEQYEGPCEGSHEGRGEVWGTAPPSREGRRGTVHAGFCKGSASNNKDSHWPDKVERCVHLHHPSIQLVPTRGFVENITYTYWLDEDRLAPEAD